VDNGRNFVAKPTLSLLGLGSEVIQDNNYKKHAYLLRYCFVGLSEPDDWRDKILFVFLAMALINKPLDLGITRSLCG
jgi:hypothetical protein